MIILAIDTAGADCSVALYNSDLKNIVSEQTETIGKGHAERLMAMISQVCEDAGLALDSVHRIAVTIGPGSFTGIRVGVSAARGLALALNIPVVGISTLSVLAAAERSDSKDRPLLVAMDAKREAVYCQLFGPDGEALNEPQAMPIADARALAAETGAALTGSGAGLLAGDSAGPADRFPIGLVAGLGAIASPVSDKASPLYLRGADAKPQVGFAVAHS
jgi:tRNA threonylcarbamoyladenosine biosynthesis protein TsaB